MCPLQSDPGVFADVAFSDVGERLWAFLNKPINIDRMLTATRLERPALEGVIHVLERYFYEELVDNMRYRQLLGFFVRKVLEREGVTTIVNPRAKVRSSIASRSMRFEPTEVYQE